MYLDYFGFDEPPFSITPDPKFVFLSEKHQESLAHLVYGITRGGGAGFVQLTGEVGTGKTTISRLLLEQIPDKTNVALILNPTITPVELLENIFKELKISMRGVTGQLNRMVDKLNQYLIKTWSEGENTVVIIDEAQNLPRDTLEQLRLLTNLETDKQKLLQIILIGQPELRDTMKRNDLRQLAQRVTARYHLMPLSAEETYDYLKHRIIKAGGNATIINAKSSKAIHKATHGVPRLINIVADRALLAVYADSQNQISQKHIKVSATEVLPESHKASLLDQMAGWIKNYFLAMLAGFVSIIVILYFYKDWQIIPKPKVVPNKKPVAIIESASQNDSMEFQSFEASTSTQSWKSLFELWGTSSELIWSKAECPQVSEIGMACLRRQGNLAQIKSLNNPVLLQLKDNRMVLLTSASNHKLGVLNSKNSIQNIDEKWLDDKWLGTYFILWSMPAELLVDPLKEELDDWALKMANTIETEKIEPSALKAWLKSFQSESGLLADGIIGPETQMALSLKAYNGPILNKLN